MGELWSKESTPTPCPSCPTPAPCPSCPTPAPCPSCEECPPPCPSCPTPTPCPSCEECPSPTPCPSCPACTESSFVTGSNFWTKTYGDVVGSRADQTVTLRDIDRRDGFWTFKGNSTCVQNGAHDAACDSTRGVCSGGSKFGVSKDQMINVMKAVDAGGVHPNCPLVLPNQSFALGAGKNYTWVYIGIIMLIGIVTIPALKFSKKTSKRRRA